MSTVLRESSEAAARERLRLEAGAGRSGWVAVVRRMPLVVRRAGSEDAARSGLRYQPVAWTAIVLAAVAFWFPGRSDSDADVAAPATAVTLPMPSTTVPSAASDAAAAGTTPTTLPPPSVALPRPVTPSGPRPGATSPPTTTPVATPPPQQQGSPSTPLTVRGFGWAAALSGSGLSTADVPEGTMPVANRLGQLDKVSFVRLSGTETTLTLTENADGAREALGAGAVVVCPITDASWTEEPDQSMDAAPPWDAQSCAPGVESDGTWTFDLSRFADLDGDTGFALVPDASAPADFQLTFSP